MGNVTVKVDKAGLREFRCSAEVEEIVMDKANEIAASLGSGYGTEALHSGTTRFRAKVKTLTEEAYYHEKKHENLLRAIGGGT